MDANAAVDDLGRHSEPGPHKGAGTGSGAITASRWSDDAERAPDAA